MALQENNLMLLDDGGFPRTIDGATDSIGISTDVVIGGDLTVNGDIVSGGTMDVVVTDNFIDLSNGNVTGDKSGGLTVNVRANANQSMVAGVTFQSQADALGLFATLGITGFTPFGVIAVGDIIEISGLSDLGENSGLFTVHSVAAGPPGSLIEIKSANAASVPFCQTNFESGTESAGVLGFQLDLGIITISGGGLPDGAGGFIAKGNFATGYAASATDAAAGNPGAITYGDAASISLQEAYDDGQTIQISNLGDLLVLTDEATPKDFVVRMGGTAFNYLSTAAATDELVLGSMDGINPAVKIAMVGELSSDISFDGGGMYSIQNQSMAGALNDLNVAGQSLNLVAGGAGAGDTAALSGSGLGSAAVLTANNAYAPGASVAGDISGQIADANGVYQALAITFGAGEVNLADLITGATVSPGGAVVLSDDGGGKLVLTSAATGTRLSFYIDQQSGAGVAAGVGILIGAVFPLPGFVSSSNGAAAVQLSAHDGTSGDMLLRTGRHCDIFSMGGSIELKTQTALMGIAVNAQSGTLTLAGDTSASLTSGAAVGISGATVNIDGAGGAPTVNIGGINAGATNITASLVGGLTMVSQGAFSLTADNASTIKVIQAGQDLKLWSGAMGGANRLHLQGDGGNADAILLDCSGGGGGIKMDAQGGAILLDSNNLTLKTTAANVAIKMQGWVQQDFTASAGMGVEVKVHSATAAVVGEVFAFVDDNGGAQTEAKAIGAASPEAPGVCGSFLEGKAVGLLASSSTVQGAVVTLAFDAGGNPGPGNVGQPIYLSSTVGKASILPTTASGEHVIRLGFAHQSGTGRVMWAPQYIAKRP
jgi:hypothetical protein